MFKEGYPIVLTPILANYLYLPGRVGGQIANGGVNAGDSLTLESTANATKGFINFGSFSQYDETNVRLGINYAPPLDAQITVGQTASQNTGATVGPQLLTSTDFTNATFWTSTGWTTTPTTATHTPGNTNSLIATLTNFTPLSAGKYVISFTVSGASAGTVRPVISTPTRNGTNVSNNQAYVDFIISPSGTATLKFTPLTNFNGTISAVTVQLITPQTPWMDLHYAGVSGVEGTGFRYDNFHNMGIGSQAVQLACNGGFSANTNVGIGDGTLAKVIAGSDNFGFGSLALGSLIDGSGNIAVGLSALTALVHGGNCTALGLLAGGSTALGNASINGINTLYLGCQAANSDTGDYSNACAIGSFSTVGANGAICIGAVAGVNSAPVTNLIGICTPVPTAFLHLPASVAANASLRIPAGTAPTSPNVGDIWDDGTNLNINGIGLKLPTVGSKINIATGANATVGQGLLAGGTATISTTAVTASSLIFLTPLTGANQGILSVGTIIAGTSFVVNSSNVADANHFNWWIVN